MKKLSEIHVPKQDEEHPWPFKMGVPQSLTPAKV